MANQKFSNSFREALWETHGKKCFHCSGELLLVDMEVDHIVPEQLHYGPPEKRGEALAELGLPPTFDILGNCNLAPSCGRCNSSKSDSILVGRSVAIALTRIGRSLPLLEERLQKRRSERGLEDILRAIARSVDSGKFTRQDFQKQFDKIVFDDDRGSEARHHNFETGKIYNKSPTLGFTDRAKREMGLGRFLQSDISQAVLSGLARGDALAIKSRDGTNIYRVKAGNDLRVVFGIYGAAVVVLSILEHA